MVGTDEDAEVIRRLVVVFVRTRVLEDVVPRTVVVTTVVKKYERLVDLDADTLEEDDSDAGDPEDSDEYARDVSVEAAELEATGSVMTTVPVV